MQGFTSELPALVVAEISANHGGSLEKALDLVRAAAQSGAQAVKFQTFIPESLSIDSTSQFFKLEPNSPWSDFDSTFDLYAEARTPYAWFPELFAFSRALGLIPFSSPFDLAAIDLLEDLNCPIYKVASPEINHEPLIEEIAKTGKPVVFSLGVASRADLVLALKSFRKLSDAAVTVLQCDTAYPASPLKANLKLMQVLREEFGVTVGVSDHTIGSEVVPVAVGAGSTMFEKHLGLENQETVDSHFSATPEQFADYVLAVRRAETVFGVANFRGDIDPSFREKNTRSIFASRDIATGEKLSEENLRIVRPGFGLEPGKIRMVVGRRALADIPQGCPILEDSVEW